jgi:CAAX prenyl protease-like protein
VPFALFIGLMMADPAVEALLGTALDPRWLYAIRSVLTLLALAYFWGRYTELREAPPLRAGPVLAGVAVGLAVFVLWIVLDFPPLVIGGEEGGGFDPTVDGAIHWGLALSRLLGSALVVPMMEELFWRSWIMRWLQKPDFLGVDPHTVGWKPLVMSSVVFAAEHSLWFAGFLAGLAYGELYRRTGDVRVAVLAHGVTNGVLGVWILVTGNWHFW